MDFCEWERKTAFKHYLTELYLVIGMLLNVVPCAKERTFTNAMVTGQHDGRKASDVIEKPGKAGSKQ